MVKKIKGLEKYFVLMFLSLVTFWRGDAKADTICCGENESDETCCTAAGYHWHSNDSTCHYYS